MRLSCGVDALTWTRLARKMAIVQGADPAIATLARAMRLPGVPRRKNGLLKAVKIANCNNFEISAPALEKLLDATGKFPYGLDDSRWQQWYSAYRQAKIWKNLSPDPILNLPPLELREYSPKPATHNPQPSLRSVPLEICLTRDDRDLLTKGAAKGSRNICAYKLARNLMGTASYLEEQGITYNGHPQQLFDNFCQRCQLDLREAQTVWRSAARQAPSPSLSTEAIANCIQAWQKQQIGLRERAAAHSSIRGFFPTPAPIARYLVHRAGIKPNMRVLEPSAGSGSLADAARTAGARVLAIEIVAELVEILLLKGHEATCADFLKLPPRPEFDAAILNPPFHYEISQTRRAWEWIKPSGTIAAIVSPGIENNTTEGYRRWRQWWDANGAEIEKLPDGSFRSSLRPASIDTYLVIATKPSGY